MVPSKFVTRVFESNFSYCRHEFESSNDFPFVILDVLEKISKFLIGYPKNTCTFFTVEVWGFFPDCESTSKLNLVWKSHPITIHQAREIVEKPVFFPFSEVQSITRFGG